MLREGGERKHAEHADCVENRAQDRVFDFEMNAGVFVDDFFLFEG